MCGTVLVVMRVLSARPAFGVSRFPQTPRRLDLAVRPSDTSALRRLEARVELTDCTEKLAAIQERPIAAEANVRRLDVLDAFDLVFNASRREQEAAARVREANVRRELALRVVSAHDVSVVASDAWIAVAVAMHNDVDARNATR